ncbi:leucyl aminopeptidase [Calidithermus chliarophilus]|uniref:leucyl aminopeptidase n=1 Tax=Calidithermus chliarophilus TaxID=52023 RepID=UPI00041DCD1B|nr:leucyl aminopeptidase [Calidithermus chliarophilus]
MEITVKSARRYVDEIPAPLAIAGYWGGELTEEARKLDQKSGGQLSRVLDELKYKGDFGETLLLPVGEQFVLLFGLGRKRGVSLETVRKAGARLVHEVTRLGFKEAVAETFLAEKFGKKQASYALAEGALLGAYEFKKYKSDPEVKKLRLWLARSSGPAVDRAEIVAEAVNYARDLINEPPNVLTPAELGERAKELGREAGLEVEVWDERQIQQAGMGAFYGVAQGSLNPPRFIQMVYRPQGKPSRVVALVGKGMTFDTGGYSLKPNESMLTMKCDMAGAAAVLGTMRAVARLQPGVEVRAYVAAAENMISGGAFRVSDVLKSLSGKTVEVLNTDAEGRLTLADAITHADREGAEAIVELSTLTGACVIALGDKVAGMFSTDARLGREVQEAAERAGEKVWPMPLEEEYREMIASTTADLKNVHGRSRYGGAIVAGLFLAEFTEKPLVHLDIAGPAYTERPHALGPAGGVGFGVRTLVELLSPNPLGEE